MSAGEIAGARFPIRLTKRQAQLSILACFFEKGRDLICRS